MISLIHVFYVGKQICAMADFSLEYRKKGITYSHLYVSVCLLWEKEMGTRDLSDRAV